MNYSGLLGQSAIEYLMTYGWMLLVVAIAGGAMFSITGSQSIESVSGFTGGDIDVLDFGYDSDAKKMDVVFQNTASDTIKINYVNLTDSNRNSLVYEGPEIDVVNSNTISIFSVEEGTSTNELDITVNYNVGGLENMSQTGTVAGTLSISQNYNISHSHKSAPGNLDNILANMDGEGTEENPYQVTNDHQLQAISADLNAYYRLENNIGAYNTENWNNGAGFSPIGNSSNGFEGEIDGKDNDIQILTINRSEESQIGLIGQAGSQSKLKNIYLRNANIKGYERVGALVGRPAGDVEINNSHSTGSVIGTGSWRAGGLIGHASNGVSVFRSSSAADVEGGTRVGGLIGQIYAGVEVKESFATGDVRATGGQVGGLVGRDHGDNDNLIENSYALGDIRSGGRGDGLVGTQGDNSPGEEVTTVIRKSFAAGPADGYGFVGSVRSDGYAEGYWDIASTGQNEGTDDPDGETDLTGLSTNDMQGTSAEENMPSLDFEDTWQTVDGEYPRLKWEQN